MCDRWYHRSKKFLPPPSSSRSVSWREIFADPKNNLLFFYILSSGSFETLLILLLILKRKLKMKEKGMKNENVQFSMNLIKKFERKNNSFLSFFTNTENSTIMRCNPLKRCYFSFWYLEDNAWTSSADFPLFARPLCQFALHDFFSLFSLSNEHLVTYDACTYHIYLE